jgi:beta-glucosidase
MGAMPSLLAKRVATDADVTQLAQMFPVGFRFGVATSSYQIEGAVEAGGRGESIWDRFSHTAGNTHAGQTGDVACDHFHRYPEDIRFMAEMGVSTYRFSIAWPRIIPDGVGAVNEAGLDFYDRLVDELLVQGVEPFPVLYHWDLPQVLEDRGGWYQPTTVEAFRRYTETVVKRLGDRVDTWTTLNEPWVSAWFGYGDGSHAPGRADGPAGAVATGHMLLRAHAEAVAVIRELAPKSKVGITLDLWPACPATASEDDKVAADRADASKNRWFLDPLFRGTYPVESGELMSLLPEGAWNDLPAISAPLDFLGVNFYSRRLVALDPGTSKPRSVPDENARKTGLGWEICPDALRDLLIRLTREYGIGQLYVTENGAAYNDRVDDTGTISDTDRIDYLRAHFSAAADAAEAGVNLAGYFVWSLLDNFEWARGYEEHARFGLIYVDWETQQRIPKQSAGWYADLIAAHQSAHGE